MNFKIAIIIEWNDFFVHTDMRQLIRTYLNLLSCTSVVYRECFSWSGYKY